MEKIVEPEQKIKSIKNPDVFYIETKKIKPTDIKKNVNLYELSALNENIVVALGNSIIIKDNLRYNPVYFIKKNRKAIQIGVYEYKSGEVPKKDTDGNFDAEHVGSLILYSFVSQQYLENNKFVYIPEAKNEPSPELDIKENPDKIPIYDGRKDIFRINPKILVTMLPTETPDMELGNLTYYTGNDRNKSWIQECMKNFNYRIVETVTDGTCFFDAIRLGFETIGENTTIINLKQKIIDTINGEDFTIRKDTYNFVRDGLRNNMDELENFKKDLEDSSREDEKSILKLKIKNVKEDLTTSKAMYATYSIMRGVTTLDQLKEKFKDKDFWADEWSIARLEYILNVKVIIINTNCSIECGILDEKVGLVFNPDYYIILEKTPNHYRLITYKDKGALNFSEIPYKLKNKIVETCMKGEGGSFNKIQDFLQLRNKILETPVAPRKTVKIIKRAIKPPVIVAVEPEPPVVVAPRKTVKIIKRPPKPPVIVAPKPPVIVAPKSPVIVAPEPPVIVAVEPEPPVVVAPIRTVKIIKRPAKKPIVPPEPPI